MNNLAHITVSFSLARQLKEAGWPQENNQFYWILGETGGWRCWHYTVRDEVADGSDVAAPTAEELFNILPEMIRGKLGSGEDASHWLTIEKAGGNADAQYVASNGSACTSSFPAPTIAETLGQLFLYAKRNRFLILLP